MFPITCNAFGDILAVVQLVRDIALSLNDARGAVAEYKRLVHELDAVGTIMEEAYRVADDARMDAVRDHILQDARLCCQEISDAGELISGFESFSRSALNDTGTTRARLVVKKLQWHFLRASDAGSLADRLHIIRQRLHIFIGLLTHRNLSDGIQSLTERLDGLWEVDGEDHVLTRLSIVETQAMIIAAVHHASAQTVEDIIRLRQDIALKAAQLSDAASERDRLLVERTSDMILSRLSIEAHASERPSSLFALLPYVIVATTFAMDADGDTHWRTAILWASVCALIIHVLHMQANLPSSVLNVGDNIVIFVDALGERIPLALQICDAPETFHAFLESFYTVTKREGFKFVQRRSYQLHVADSTEALTSSSWPSCVVRGTVIEMGVLLQRHSDPGDAVPSCPYCNSASLHDHMCNRYLCMGCARTFEATTREQLAADRECAHPLFALDSQHNDEPEECIYQFVRVCVVKMVDHQPTPSSIASPQSLLCSPHAQHVALYPSSSPASPFCSPELLDSSSSYSSSPPDSPIISTPVCQPVALAKSDEPWNESTLQPLFDDSEDSNLDVPTLLFSPLSASTVVDFDVPPLPIHSGVHRRYEPSPYMNPISIHPALSADLDIALAYPYVLDSASLADNATGPACAKLCITGPGLIWEAEVIPERSIGTVTVQDVLTALDAYLEHPVQRHEYEKLPGEIRETVKRSFAARVANNAHLHAHGIARRDFLQQGSRIVGLTPSEREGIVNLVLECRTGVHHFR